MTTGMEAWDRKRENRLLIAVQNFIEKHDIHSAETIYQMDRIAEDSLVLIQDLCDIVGYIKSEEE